MKKWISVFLVGLVGTALMALTACNRSASQPQSADASGESSSSQMLAGLPGGELPPATDAASGDGDTAGGAYSVITLVAPPDNTVHSETVVIEATGDIVTHLQITTGSDVDNPNNDIALQSYQHWLPILRDYYSALAGFEFSADEAAGTWTIDVDINDDTIQQLAEYYVDLSPYKRNGHLSKELLVGYYTDMLGYTAAEQ